MNSKIPSKDRVQLGKRCDGRCGVEMAIHTVAWNPSEWRGLIFVVHRLPACMCRLCNFGELNTIGMDIVNAI